MKGASVTNANAPLVDFVLPAELGIYCAAQTQQALIGVLSSWPSDSPRTTMGLRGDAVETIDASGVQLLLSLHRSLEARGLQLQIFGASDPLRHGLDRMGTISLLGCCH